MNPRTPADCLSHIMPDILTEKEKQVAIARIEQLVAAERTIAVVSSILSDLPDGIRNHAIETLMSVAQTIRAAYCSGQVRAYEDVTGG
jgi:hypothetical protein